jgi:hypothetical protein
MAYDPLSSCRYLFVAVPSEDFLVSRSENNSAIHETFDRNNQLITRKFNTVGKYVRHRTDPPSVSAQAVVLISQQDSYDA